MPRSSRTGNLIFDPGIEKTARKLKKEAKLRKQQTGTWTSPMPQGTPLWNEPEHSFQPFPKAPATSPVNSLFKTYSSSSSDNPELTDSSQTESEFIMSENGDEAEKTPREWVTQEVTQQPLCITFLEAHFWAQIRFNPSAAPISRPWEWRSS